MVEGRIQLVMPEFDVSNGLLASLVAASVSTLGLLSMTTLGDWGRRQSSLFSAFAVGILTVSVLFHLAPEALSTDPTAWQAMAGSLLLLVGVGVVMRFLIGVGNGASALAFGFASVIALGFHSFIDGIVYESTFHGDEYTGWTATLGLLLHEFPEGVIAFFLMRESGLGKVASTITAFIVSSVTTVFGALVAGVVLESATFIQLGQLLGLTAGAIAYIIVFHLGPHGALAPRPRGYLVGALGVVIATTAEIIRHGVAGH